MDTAFAKIVTDTFGTDHIVIEGTLISLIAPRDKNNELVDLIVRGLRGVARQGLAGASVLGEIAPARDGGSAG